MYKVLLKMIESWYVWFRKKIPLYKKNLMDVRWWEVWVLGFIVPINREKSILNNLKRMSVYQMKNIEKLLITISRSMTLMFLTSEGKEYFCTLTYSDFKISQSRASPFSIRLLSELISRFAIRKDKSQLSVVLFIARCRKWYDWLPRIPDHDGAKNAG